MAAGPERLAPLAIAEPGQEGAGPTQVVWRDAVAHQFLMPAVIAEDHEPISDADDGGVAFELIRIVPRRSDPTGFAQRRAEIADDVPLRGVTARAADVVQRVVRVLEVEAVEHEQDREQTLVRPHPDERVHLPRPLAAASQRRLVQAETSAGLDARARCVAHREGR